MLNPNEERGRALLGVGGCVSVLSAELTRNSYYQWRRALPRVGGRRRRAHGRRLRLGQGRSPGSVYAREREGMQESSGAFE